MTTDTKDMLLDALLQAHADSALRGNISHEALRLAAVGSEDYLKAICAALMTRRAAAPNLRPARR
jgi:hypothetical protein